MTVYNIFPLLVGKFTKWERHLIRASDMGFNWIFVNPVQRPGRSGSIYTIADYYAINQKLVDEKSPKAPYEQLKEVIAAAYNLGLKIIVDLVINHCSTDSDLITSHPNWFYGKRKSEKTSLTTLVTRSPTRTGCCTGCRMLTGDLGVH